MKTTGYDKQSMRCTSCNVAQRKRNFYDPRKLGKHSTVCWSCRKKLAFERFGPKKTKQDRAIEQAERALARDKAERDLQYAR